MKRTRKYRQWNQVFNRFDDDVYSDDQSTLSQLLEEDIDEYIGMDDIDGTEIYENDYCLTFNDYKGERPRSIILVKWDTGIANCGCCGQIWASGYDLGDDPKMIRVVGNTYTTTIEELKKKFNI